MNRIGWLFASGALCAAAWAQTAARPEFEVASIKPTDPDFVGIGLQMRPDDNRVVVRGLTLKDLIGFTYSPGFGRLASSLISGGPSWYDRDRYDIVAKSDGQPIPSQEVRMRMLRRLLEERFELKVHRESKVTEVLGLVVTKTGPKMKVSAPNSSSQGTGFSPSGFSARNVSMEKMISFLQDVLQRDPLAGGLPVLNRTGLTANFDFDFKLDFVRRTGELQTSGELESISAALREQLGLDLKLIKAPIDAIVVDHAKRPIEN
jgi:uncharacterized protein (TIGR03435 family)